MKLTVIGSGSATPIPRQNCQCSQCTSDDPRDRRFPSALLVDGKLLIDAPPMVDQLLKSLKSRKTRKSQKIQYVLITHEHHDASGGLPYLKSRGVKICAHQGCEDLDISIEPFMVPHGSTSAQGFMVNNLFVYCSDYSDIELAIPYLKKVRAAFLDGSGWETCFPSHQPMVQVIPIVKKLKKLEQIYFTHNGHAHLPHIDLKKKVRQLGDDRFAIAYHGLTIKI